jgi:hypothetical protein
VKRSSAGGAVTACLLLASAAPLWAAEYRAVDITPPGLPAGTGAEIGGISDRQIAGTIRSNQVAANTQRAVVWNLATHEHTVLHGGRYTDTTAQGAGGAQQVGTAYDYSVSPTAIHAVTWRGSPETMVSLHPTGAWFSQAMGTDGGRHVGQVVYSGEQPIPALWNNPLEFVDLTPPGFIGGIAYAIRGGRQAGVGYTDIHTSHAMLWSGTAATAVDLHPAGAFYESSRVSGLEGDQQVGYAGGSIISRPQHAMLWRGTAASAVDLHPAGFDTSAANGTNGVQQVGSAGNGPFHFYRGRHAMVWSGTAESAVDLHPFLPAGLTSSFATGIDAAGNVYGTAFTEDLVPHAIVWTVVPEPSCAAMLAGVGLGLLARRRSWRSRAMAQYREPRSDGSRT